MGAVLLAWHVLLGLLTHRHELDQLLLLPLLLTLQKHYLAQACLQALLDVPLRLGSQKLNWLNWFQIEQDGPPPVIFLAYWSHGRDTAIDKTEACPWRPCTPGPTGG